MHIIVKDKCEYAENLLRVVNFYHVHDIYKKKKLMWFSCNILQMLYILIHVLSML